MKDKLTKVDLWFKSYEEMEGNQQYNFVLETMKNPLEEEFIEGIDFVDILISTKTHLIQTYQLHKLKEFIELVKKNQPQIYKESFEYIENTAISYYLFKNDMDSVKEALKIFIEEPIKSIDILLGLLRKIQYYNKNEVAVNLSKAVCLLVSQSNDLMFNAETDFIWSIYLDVIEQLVIKSKIKSFVDYDLIENMLTEYDSKLKREKFDKILEIFGDNEILFSELDFSSKKKRKVRKNFLILLVVTWNRIWMIPFLPL